MKCSRFLIAAAASALFLTGILISSPARAQENKSASTITLEGTVMVLAATIKNQHYITITLLKDRSGKKWMLLGKDVRALKAGQLVRVRGKKASGRSYRSAADSYLRVQSVRVLRQAKPRSARANTGKQPLLIAWVSWPGAAHTSLSATEKNSYQLLKTQSLAASDGVFSWDPVNFVEMSLPTQPLCEEGAWYDAVATKAQALGYDIVQYRGVAIVLPPAVTCVSGAYAYIGGNLSIYSSGAYRPHVFVHELGHNLGSYHAHSMECTTPGGADVALSYTGNCFHQEYGDSYDPMGSSGARSMYDPVVSSDISWLQSSDVKVSTPSSQARDFTLYPYGGLGNDRVLKMALPPSANTDNQSPGILFAEYRANAGIDNTLYNSSLYQGSSVSCIYRTPQNNIFLRWQPTFNATYDLKNFSTIKANGYLLDTTPGDGDRCDAGLAPGSSWTDPTGKLTVKFQSRTSNLSSATIRVTGWDRSPTVPQWISAPPSPNNLDEYEVEYKVRFPGSVIEEVPESAMYNSGTAPSCSFYASPGNEDDTYFIVISECGNGTLRPTIRAGSLTDPYLYSFPSSDAQGPEIIIDQSTPRPVLKEKPPRRTRSRRAVFRFYSPEPGVALRCGLRNMSPCKSQKVYKNLSTGRYVFRVQAKDKAGNWNSTRYSWRVVG